MPDLTGATSDAMDLGAPQIQHLSEITERLNFLLRAAEQVTRELNSALRLANDTVKRFEELRKPRPTMTVEQVREENRPTALAKGPQHVLSCLRQFPDYATDVRRIADLCLMSESTVRTYIPILRRAGLLHPTELKLAS